MINCLIIDDDFLSKSVLDHYCEENPSTEVLGSFDCALKALKFKEIGKVDLIFTDIQMPDCDGIEFVKRVNSEAQIVFTTGYEKYALEAFNHNVLDYLLKPIYRDRFDKTIDKYLSTTAGNEESMLFRSEGKDIKLLPSEILYFESYGDYIKINTLESVHIIHSTMTKLLENVPDNFIRIHRKYIVNNNNISKSDSNEVWVNDVGLSISKKYKNDYKELLKK